MPDSSTGKTPFIISASRATDIPAFHGTWFMERLRAGFCRRRNPFNRAQESFISFEKTRLFVFWSKNPAPFLKYLPEIESTGRQFYFQYTLNDYEEEGLEPNLPVLRRRLDGFRRLADMAGPQRVIWRFDPIILGGELTVEHILDKVERIGRELSPCTEKLVFSFVDMYRGSTRALHRLNPGYRAPLNGEMLALAQGIAERNASWPHRLELAACAESIDLRAQGIVGNKCIDGTLIARLCPHDAELLAAIAPQRKQLSLLPDVPESAPKDRGQRPACGCIPSRDIGAYGTCPHLCVYCYANKSEAEVRRNMKLCLSLPEDREFLLDSPPPAPPPLS